MEHIDRFSSLPDHIAHHILSFLSMEDISRFCIVSKTCRELCISIPVLTFDAFPYRDNAPKRNQLMNYLDRFLLLRKGMDTTHCYIKWTIQNNVFEEEYRVISLLHNEVMCKVPLLQVMLEKEGIFTLPPSVLCCGSWKTLTINLRNGILKFPSFVDTFGFSDLRSLSLSAVQINESFGKWVSSYWQLLEYLDLHDISGTESLIITSSSLQILKIWSLRNAVLRINVSAEFLRELRLVWTFRPEERVLELSTPRLTHFICGGSILNFSLKGNLDSLFMSGSLFEFPSVANTSTSQCLRCFLSGVRNSKFLTIFSQSIQLLFRHSHRPIHFDRLEMLSIIMKTCNISDELVLGLTSFLGGTPILRGLHLASKLASSHCRGEVVYGETWELQNFEFIHYLSEVIIELCVFGRNDLELLKHLLKHADNLLRMNIYSTTLQSHVITEIEGCERASAKVEIQYFVENNLILNLKMEKKV